MFSWFESLIDPFRPASLEQPPAHRGCSSSGTISGRSGPPSSPCWSFGFFGGIIELALFAFLGEFVDLARTAATPADFFAEHGTRLIWMAVIALLLRPIVFGLHIVSHQSGPSTGISPI